ncbi:MAG: hypothetical protein ACW98K_00925 [Candidatus Kariarchaeaceae archaeon]|jgi:hypothetical protein
MIERCIDISILKANIPMILPELKPGMLPLEIVPKISILREVILLVLNTYDHLSHLDHQYDKNFQVSQAGETFLSEISGVY